MQTVDAGGGLVSTGPVDSYFHLDIGCMTPSCRNFSICRFFHPFQAHMTCDCGGGPDWRSRLDCRKKFPMAARSEDQS